jgi:hypothetical protein
MDLRHADVHQPPQQQGRIHVDLGGRGLHRQGGEQQILGEGEGEPAVVDGGIEGVGVVALDDLGEAGTGLEEARGQIAQVAQQGDGTEDGEPAAARHRAEPEEVARHDEPVQGPAARVLRQRLLTLHPQLPRPSAPQGVEIGIQLHHGPPKGRQADQGVAGDLGPDIGLGDAPRRQGGTGGCLGVVHVLGPLFPFARTLPCLCWAAGGTRSCPVRGAFPSASHSSQARDNQRSTPLPWAFLWRL